MKPRLRVEIRNPKFGKSWYVLYVPCDYTATDESIIKLSKERSSEATAVRIIREYQL